MTKLSEQNHHSQHWSAEKNSRFNPPWIVRYDPTPSGVENADGSKTWGMSVPVLQITKWVENREKVVTDIAASLNARDAMVEALKSISSGGHCQVDIKNPCFDNRPNDVLGKHWGGGNACSHCLAVGLLSLAQQTPPGPDKV
jgi:hypothetical protein